MTEVLKTLQELNRAWRESRFEDLGGFLDADIVMKGPGLKELGRGREALVQSYAEFMGQSRIVAYAESEHSANTWGDTAAVTYHWTMTYEQKGETTKRESGQDMFVFVRRDARWIAVLRVMLF